MAIAGGARAVPRRVKGEGTVYYNNHLRLWVAQKYVGARRVTAYGKSRTEALQKLNQKIGSGNLDKRSKMTLGRYLDGWLKWKRLRGDIRPETLKSYEDIVRLYVKPYLGDYRLSDVTTEALDMLYARLRQQGLSTRTIRYAHALVGQALKQAVVWKFIRENPAEYASPPSESHSSQPDIWSPEETQQFFDALQGDPLYPLFYTAATTGLRLEELLALQWQDIDLEHGTLTVARAVGRDRQVKAPKTEASARTITLPPDTVEVLKAHKPEDAKPEDWVFPNNAGRVWDRQNLRRAFLLRCQRAGVRPMPLKNFRHLHATLLLRSGVDLALVSKRLGHTNMSTAPRFYLHISREMERRTAIPLDQLLRPQRTPPTGVSGGNKQ